MNNIIIYQENKFTYEDNTGSPLFSIYVYILWWLRQ